jgi:hypothetical protein
MVLVLQGTTVATAYEHLAVGPVMPAPDGRVIYTGLGGIFNDRLKAIPRNPAGHPFLLPSADLNYYLSISGLLGPGGPPRRLGTQPSTSPTKPRCGIHIAGESAPLIMLDPFDEMAPERDGWLKTDFTPDKRYHFVPAANLLITIPESDDQLVLRRVDVLELLHKTGIDYLFVTSTPNPTAVRGETYTYQIESRSNRGDLKYMLSSGPEGMTISPSGTLTWEVPANYDGQDLTAVVVSISDASGQETFHSFTLRIR